MFRETGCYPVSTNGMGLFGGGYNLFDDGYELVVVVVVGVGAEEYGFVVLECHLFRAGVVVVIVEESVGEHLVGGVVPVPFGSGCRLRHIPRWSRFQHTMCGRSGC